MGTRLFVGNLSYDTNENDLRDLFGQIGAVSEVKVVLDRETGRPRGFGFVEMSSADEAAAAIEQVNGRELGGRTLNVNQAEARSSAPRASRGGGVDRRW
jgi:RNA recognition motif-containing protein